MERKSEEHQAAHAGQRGKGLSLRSHSAAERFATRKERNVQAGCFHGCGTHGGMSQRRRVRPLGTALHVGKLISEGRDAALGKAVGDMCQEWMGHPSARAVSED